MSFVSDLFGGNDAADAARDASDAQLQSTRESNELLREIWGQSRDDLEPWRQAGMSGLNQLMRLTGLPTVSTTPNSAGGINSGGMTEAQLREQLTPMFTSTTYGSPDWYAIQSHPDYQRYVQSNYTNPTPALNGLLQGQTTSVNENALNAEIKARMDSYNAQQQQAQQAQQQPTEPVDTAAILAQDPGYQFRLQQGNQALDRQQAARGTLLSGRAMKDASAYNSGMASQEYGNAWNRLANIAGIGQSATSESNALGSSYGQQMAGNIIQGGNARASGYLAQGQASQGGFNNLLNAAGTGAALWTAFSDRRLKRNIRRVGTHASGLPWYEYEIFGRTEQGVMADEAQSLRPDAVSTHPSGYLMVDYGAL